MEQVRTTLTEYEENQIGEILEWKAEEPSVVSQILGVVLFPITWLINQIVPTGAIAKALDFSSDAAGWLTDTADIVRDAQVASVADLRTLSLETSDELAAEVHVWALGLACAEGGVTGAAGLPGMALDIPALIIMALRTIHKIGVCYGFQVETAQDREFVLAILAAAGANNMEEKAQALITLQTVQRTVMKQTWTSLAQKAAADRMAGEAGRAATRKLARQLGMNLTKRKALQAIPAIGAVVGATVNSWYMTDVGLAARRVFQERWLIENGKITGVRLGKPPL